MNPKEPLNNPQRNLKETLKKPYERVYLLRSIPLGFLRTCCGCIVWKPHPEEDGAMSLSHFSQGVRCGGMVGWLGLGSGSHLTVANSGTHLVGGWDS